MLGNFLFGREIIFIRPAHPAIDNDQAWLMLPRHFRDARNINILIVIIFLRPCFKFFRHVFPRPNSLGVATSRLASLTLGVPAFIAQQPQPVTVIPGQTAGFTVGAGGTPPFSFQWYLNCVTPLAGATFDTLVFTNVSEAESGSYCVLVSNAFGSEFSSPARLRVLSPPNFFFITRTGTVVTVTFSTLTNQNYTVQFKDMINAAEWSVLRKGSNLPGTGFPMNLQDPQATVPQRFYRVLLE